jgi:CheY-like chemotaxis protein
MSRTILVVDDEPDLAANCERVLQREGHSCLQAHTGPDAIRLIDRERPALVVTDLRLPGAGGLTVARHARSRMPPIPVILITAYDSPQARIAAKESGVSSYLAKPFSNAAFLESVERALAPAPSDVDSRGRGRVD